MIKQLTVVGGKTDDPRLRLTSISSQWEAWRFVASRMQYRVGVRGCVHLHSRRVDQLPGRPTSQKRRGGTIQPDNLALCAFYRTDIAAGHGTNKKTFVVRWIC